MKIAYEASQHLMSGLIKREKGEGDFIKEFELALQKANHPGALYLINENER
ncbi:MAG: hypothetical protein GWN01_11550, partial [Nitrosopumilaceae archaeon]|nr:hypothetical protein [Nitrosopumilaceae archaeon]NIU87942.1 hypothetical protein [Nitrosopumilaceae archaeon]NIV66218.1 hypothetical protein [Nitrosopumilaceae archaeon]NIX62115.1 hypothetical protein [Nitrosopumilaceae archaeon]